MTTVPSAAELIHLGMDTSMNEIVVAVLRPGQEIPVVDRIPADEESVRRLIGRFPDRRLLSACYEAGPGGYELHRLLTSMGWPATWSPRRWSPRAARTGSRPISGTRCAWC